MHAAIKAQTEKPRVAEMWRHDKGNTVVSSVYCNMGIHIIKISCIVTGGGLNGTDKPLADEFGPSNTSLRQRGHIRIILT